MISSTEHLNKLLLKREYSALVMESERGLERLPEDINLMYFAALGQQGLGMTNEAAKYYERILHLNPKFLGALYGLGQIKLMLFDYHRAASLLDRLIALDNKNCWAFILRGNVSAALGDHQSSFSFYSAAREVSPATPEVFLSIGNSLQEMWRFEEALHAYDSALSLKPNYSTALSNRAAVLNRIGRLKEALSSVNQAIAFAPRNSDAWSNRGAILSAFRMHKEAAESYLKALEYGSARGFELGMAHHQKMLICDWANYDDFVASINQGVAAGSKVADPFGYQGIAESEELLFKCSRIYSSSKHPAHEAAARNLRKLGGKIRLGYLCGEFRDHATSILMASVWENHDRSKFEIHAFDSGILDSSRYGSRVRNTFDSVTQVAGLPTQDVVELIRGRGIDILINLNGFFGAGRQDVFAARAAPIQVNYLGFPGSIGAQYMDYLVADEIVIPRESRRFYSERVVYLPYCYQPNDSRREKPNVTVCRSDFAIPKDSFVFCNFNNNYKITPNVFDAWAKVLRRVPGSVLWLLKDSDLVEINLRKEALSRGVSQEQIFFAERCSLDLYLQRFSISNLFLDTWPYNAHTTAADSLFMGLPIVTLVNPTFPGRVSSSLLKQLGMDSLVTKSEDAYIDLAVRLACDPEMLTRINQALRENYPRFNVQQSEEYTVYLESAFQEMYQRYVQNLNPTGFSVCPDISISYSG